MPEDILCKAARISQFQGNIEGIRYKEVRAGASLSTLFDHTFVPPHTETDVLAAIDSNIAAWHSKHLCLAQLAEFVADEIPQFITKAAGQEAAVLGN